MFNFKTDRFKSHVTYTLVINGWLGRFIIRRRIQLSREQDIRFNQRKHKSHKSSGRLWLP